MKNGLTALCMVITITTFAQQLNNSINFPTGKKLEMVTTISSNASTMGGVKMQTVVTRHFDIEKIENGNAVIEHKTKRLQFNMESMFANQSFDSEKEDDMKDEIGKAVAKELKAKYTVIIDPSGKVVSSKADDIKEEAKPTEDGRMVQGMLEQMGISFAPPVAGSQTELAFLPSQPYKAGDSWTDSAANGVTVYNVKSLNDSEAVVAYTQTMRNEISQEAQGIQININSTDKTAGEIKIDRSTGLIKEHTATITTEGTMSYMGQEMPMNSTTTKNIVVKW